MKHFTPLNGLGYRWRHCCQKRTIREFSARDAGNLLILKSLANERCTAYGVAESDSRELGVCSRRWNEGALYPALHCWSWRGLLARRLRRWGTSRQPTGGRSFYSLTTAGKISLSGNGILAADCRARSRECSDSVARSRIRRVSNCRVSALFWRRFHGFGVSSFGEADASLAN